MIFRGVRLGYAMEKLEFGDVVPLYDLLDKCSRFANSFAREHAARLKSQVTIFRHTILPEARTEVWNWLEWTYWDLRNFVESHPTEESQASRAV